MNDSSDMDEQGPEAAATLARMTDREIVFKGEGGHIEIGVDGPTFCVVTESGTLVDLMADDDVDESDWRRGLSIHRFATREERDAYIEAQPWRDYLRSPPDRAVTETVDPKGAPPTHFELSLDAGLSNSHVRVAATGDGDRQVAAYTIEFEERPSLGGDVELSPSEWARFNEELVLLGVRDCRDYGINALDGLSWTLSYYRHSKAFAQGCNAYPPHGDIDISPEFTRLLLAAERMLGRELWPGFPIANALRRIPDERDRIEHTILSAVRTWAADQHRVGVDPRRLTENDVEKGLTPYIAALVPAHKQRHIKGLLTDWPGVGRLDVEIETPLGPPAWLELKWAKTASTLHNCLWDAAKLAVAERESTASYGYLLAGAPDLAWHDHDLRGPIELFKVSTHHGTALVDDSFSWWKGWYDENEGTYPLRLPAPIVTVPIGRVFMRGPDGVVAGEPWTLRLARVHAPGNATYVPRPRT